MDIDALREIKFADNSTFLIFIIVVIAVWKSLPDDVRLQAELKSPRLVGFLRVLEKLFVDVIGAARVVRYQVIQGIPREQARASHPPPFTAEEGNATQDAGAREAAVPPSESSEQEQKKEQQGNKP